MPRGSVFCFDSDLPMGLIGRELLVGNRLGELPDDVPMVPLQQDLQKLQKRLRLKPEASEKLLDLDLRNDNDRERSHLLHRLRLLGISWGTPGHAGGKGTFRETWKLRWEPGFEVQLIEAGVLGTTIEEASAGKLRQLADASADLPSSPAICRMRCWPNSGRRPATWFVESRAPPLWLLMSRC